MVFNGNQTAARNYLSETGLMPGMLDKSRFCRRLDSISGLMVDLFHQIGMGPKQASTTPEYLLDSFAIALCDNIHLSYLP